MSTEQLQEADNAALLREVGRLSAERDAAERERDEARDQLDRFRRRYGAAIGDVMGTLRQRPELEHTHHRAA